eukprot:TRINITY_DN7019_c0_g1_i1.p1 TRINITY_DN7019_c0_g1~~TRINITY_DN7019_c0_g1_i1.p1  ORF type:complete len:160 (-),score=38.52 TRINITY_DN7019_c0_g1_i1:293-772(-)
MTDDRSSGINAEYGREPKNEHMYHRAGKVKRLTPKENKKEKRKEAVGRAKKRRKFNRSQLPPTVSLNRYKNKRQDGKDNTEPFFSLWAPKLVHFSLPLNPQKLRKTTTWSPASSVSFDLWYPVFNSPSDKYTNEISHHQEVDGMDGMGMGVQNMKVGLG